MSRADHEMDELDEAVDEVRRVRKQISANYDHDPDKYGEHRSEYQTKFGDRLVLPPTRKNAERPAA
ncbi:MAG TPA: hypothetical protein VFJ82_26695 [Longimicrobium sp.]|nr:hypothetical protein [Longimicrobium sp.]